MTRALTILLLVAALALPGCATLTERVTPWLDRADETPVTFPGARFETELGAFTIVFYPNDAPLTVDLIRTLIDEGYYDGREFVRVVPGHVIQVTDRAGGATDDARRVPLEVASNRTHFSAGALGIARGEAPDSGGPEIFVMDYATSHLRGNYTVFAQVVAGLDTVHAIARVPTIQLSRIPPAALLLTDSMARDPVAITKATLAQVALPAEQARQLPPVVAQNARSGNYRYSLEWPADLAPQRASTFTWYVRPYNDTASLDPARLTMRVEAPGLGAWQPTLTPHAQIDEILAWRWAPPAAGAYNATLRLDGHPLATLRVDVPGP